MLDEWVLGGIYKSRGVLRKDNHTGLETMLLPHNPEQRFSLLDKSNQQLNCQNVFKKESSKIANTYFLPSKSQAGISALFFIPSKNQARTQLQEKDNSRLKQEF